MAKVMRCHVMKSLERMVHDTYPHRYHANPGMISFVSRMSHTIRNKQKLILRSKRIRGQFQALERVLDEGRDCSEVLQIIGAARGAVNSLMTELLEGHIRHHVLDPKRKPNSEQTVAADEVIDMVKTYLR
jgi:DNA-binding FrmR family transcriptional regulator